MIINYFSEQLKKLHLDSFHEVVLFFYNYDIAVTNISIQGE